MAADHGVFRLTDAAEADCRQILKWELENFGRAQTRAYAVNLSASLKVLSVGPVMPGVGERAKIGAQIRTLHVARKGRKGRHCVVFRVDDATGRQVIDVQRFQHDGMDLKCHLPSDALRGRELD